MIYRGLLLHLYVHAILDNKQTHRMDFKVKEDNLPVKVSIWTHVSHRLLHSPNLVAIGLPVGYETWPPIGWHHPFVIGWSKDRLGFPSAPLHYGLTWPVGIPIVFQTPVIVPMHSPNGRNLFSKSSEKTSHSSPVRVSYWAVFCEFTVWKKF